LLERRSHLRKYHAAVFRSPQWRTAIVVLIVLLAAVALYPSRVAPKMADFEVYWRAGLRAAAGESLYRSGDGHYQFKYLPGFAVLVSPWTLLPHAAARFAWFMLCVSAVIGLIAASVRLWPEWRPTWLLVLGTTVVLGKFYAHELVLGQTNAMFGAVIVAAVLALARGREGLAGALIALGVVLKPYGLLFVPWLVLRRQWMSIATVAAGLVSAAGLPLWRYSATETVALHRQWWSTVRDTTSPNLLSADNVSWLAMYTKWLGDDTAWPVRLWIATGLLATVTFVWLWRLRAPLGWPERLEVALLLLLIPLVSPQGWDYVLVLATPCVMCLIACGNRLPPWMRVVSWGAMGVIGLTLYDVVGRDAYGAFMMRSGITVCTFALFAALAMLRVRRVA
jgi:hypothetical protein